MNAPLKRTPVYDIHVELGARMVEFAGFDMPIQYAGLKAEHLAVRETAGLFDVSHMGELRVRGDAAICAVNRLITNDLSALSNGKALYTFCCNESGGILDDLIVYRIADDEVYVVCNASNREKIAAHFARELDGQGVAFEDESDNTALLAIQGPLAVQSVQTLSTTKLTDLASFSATSAVVAGIPCFVARTGYTGEDGLEIFCAWDQAATLFRALLQHATPVGLGARDTLRLEARLLLYGNDIDEACNPFETGFAWVVKFDKRDGTDFIGKASLQKIQAQGVKRRLVGFEMRGRGIARATYPLLAPAEGEASTGAGIGHCTSGSPSPTLGTSIGLGYVPVDFSKPGQKINVDCRGKLIAAEVVKTPFYRRPSP
jgi:aminomethyltransferase